jgi:hypothetical protein
LCSNCKCFAIAGFLARPLRPVGHIAPILAASRSLTGGRTPETSVTR